jgi:hypothetical protein
VLWLWYLLRRSQQKAGQAAQFRSRRAVDGEQLARDILATYGYNVIASQHRHQSQFFVDRVAVPIEVRLDFIVEKDGQSYVAEVKTGTQAPEPSFPATRRQLLEYSLIFPDWPVLLVDVPAGKVHLIEFDDWVD